MSVTYSSSILISMHNLKRVLRLAGLIILIILACSGVAMVPFTPRREPMKRETTIELVEEDGEEELP
ncbi:MAG: hypothetical protein SH819_03255 [Cytophagales bacterium]|nr:hypothetical protein [Cytophagales bacterium]